MSCPVVWILMKVKCLRSLDPSIYFLSFLAELEPILNCVVVNQNILNFYFPDTSAKLKNVNIANSAGFNMVTRWTQLQIYAMCCGNKHWHCQSSPVVNPCVFLTSSHSGQSRWMSCLWTLVRYHPAISVLLSALSHSVDQFELSLDSLLSTLLVR